jgi:hypothetical protein
MAAFDGSIKTKTRVALDKDKFSPGMGALAGSGNTEHALIHGNRLEKIDTSWSYQVGTNLTRLIMGNASTRIMGSEARTVIGNFHETILGTAYNFVGGTHSTFNGSPKTSFFLGALTETHCQPRHIIEPTNLYKVIGFKGEVVYIMSQTNNVSKVEFNGMACAVSLYKCDLAMLKTDAKTLENKACVLKTEATALKAIVGAIKGGINAARAKVAAVGALVGARLGGPPTSVGGN